MIQRLAGRLLLVLFLAGCGTTASAHLQPQTQPHLGSQHAPSASAARLLAARVAQPIPARNLYTLADQLKLRPPRSIPRVIRHTSPNYPVGHEDQFYVLGEDANSYFTMHARIVARTPHLYIYLQDGVNLNTTDVQKAADHFEKSTYPTDRSYYGSEWSPGVDGDPHITCLLGDLRSGGTDGFYSAEDEYPRLVNPWSNQREMIYMNSAEIVPGNSYFDAVLAHEFQHMIHWHMHPHDNAWLNEGMSMLAEQLNHYPPADEADSFAVLPDTQLNAWSLSSDARLAAHYGGAFLFLAYLYSRYGRGFIRDMLADGRYTDFELVNDVLRKRHIRTTANQLFADWVAANWIRDRSFAHGVYGSKWTFHQAIVQKRGSVPIAVNRKVPPYAANYIQLDSAGNGKPFQLQFSAPTAVPVVGASAINNVWWSNRGDMSDTHLIRTVDLRHVHTATLHFQTWYDVEDTYDYGYVEASTDGGKTWNTLPGTHTSNKNPTGANYGNGYTGDSHGWRSESVDLSRYAGKRIQLRFQYITDDEYNGQGMLLKKIEIPEIKFRDSLQGWKTQGFVAIKNNALPARWVVELIAQTGKGTTVSRMPLSGGRGTLPINPARQGLKNLLVAVFFTAPKTTVQLPYRLSATNR